MTLLVLAPLEIKEAVEGVIKLTHIGESATALIPKPAGHESSDEISVSIAGQEVVPREPVGQQDDTYFHVQILKERLLNHTGTKKQFQYIYYIKGLNRVDSDLIEYDIFHS